MNITCTILPEHIHFSQIETYLPFLPLERQEKIARYRQEYAKITSLCAGLIIQYHISKIFSLPAREISLLKHPHGKLYLPNHPDYDFSISHSGNVIAFAESSCPVGIDVEQIRKANPAVVQRFFSPKEQCYVENSPDFTEAFYEVWTGKEAYVKMLGTGFSIPASDCDIITHTLWNKYAPEAFARAIADTKTASAASAPLASSVKKPLLFSQKAETFPLSVCSYEPLLALPSITFLNLLELLDYFS